ncbi:N-acetylmuramoyl-L-alanine amidase [Catalinimonas alkaloidigena]|nr:N-acetylmuramoyl-L-alanine amidase [Catalinimonas alkaloidigena]
MAIALVIGTGAFSSLNSKRFKVKTVVIDAGHGGHDPGNLGTGRYKTREKDIALKIALELGRIIQENMPDVKVIYTRKDDRFIELSDRPAIANKNDADLFISVHCNSGPKAAYGTESFVMGNSNVPGNLEVAKRENSVILQESDYLEKYDGFDPNSPLAHIFFANMQSAYLENSLLFADHVETQFKDRVGRHSRGVKQASLWVLWKSAMPAVLVEVGFLTNPTEEKYLNDNLGQVYIASGIYRAFRDYKKDIESIE